MLKFLLILGFAVAFGAGLVIGLEHRNPVQEPAASQPTSRGGGGPGFLRSELNLTPEQQQQMKEIWDTVHKKSREQEAMRGQIKRERDEQIAALIRPEDKDKYNDILKTYSERQEAIGRQIQAAFQSAVAQTEQILSPEQLKKYKQIMANHRGPGPDHGGPGPGPHQRDSNRRGEDRATSRPGSDK